MKDNILIIGGAGFIGSNATKYFLDKGKTVTILDNLSRGGAQKNLEWLGVKAGKLEVVVADIRYDLNVLKEQIEKTDQVLHLAAQVAVTTSVENPQEDFEINAQGTLNVLEALRTSKNKPPLIYASTNKVYGGMEQVEVVENRGRYEYKNYPDGINESFPLDFHSPYGCSKGAADQYVRDYSRIYGLETVVFRQSCIYGPRQFGVEDQGWVAWFVIALLTGKKITIYGDGKQVRDLLFVDDLVRAYELAFENMETSKGEIYNVGGGKDNTMSVWSEFKPLLEKTLNTKVDAATASWRPGDQKIYISDIKKIQKELDWKPKVGVEQGISRLVSWVLKNKAIFT